MASNGYVSSSYELKGHRQTKATACPGDYFYETIKSYPHWVSYTLHIYICLISTIECIFFIFFLRLMVKSEESIPCLAQETLFVDQALMEKTKYTAYI